MQKILYFFAFFSDIFKPKINCLDYLLEKINRYRRDLLANNVNHPQY